MEPDMRSPGLQAIGCQDALDRLGRDRRHDLIANHLPRQFGAVPLAQGSTGLLGQLTRPPHQVQRHRRGKRSVADQAADDPANPRGRPRDTDPPRSGRRWVGPQPGERLDRAAAHPPPAGRSAPDAPARPLPSSAASRSLLQHALQRPTRSRGDCVVQTSASLNGVPLTIRPSTLLPSTPQRLLGSGTYLSLDKARPREERVAGELVGAAC